MRRSLSIFAAVAAAGALARPETPEDREAQAARDKTPPQRTPHVIDETPNLERTYRALNQTDADRARIAAAQAKRERRALKRSALDARSIEEDLP